MLNIQTPNCKVNGEVRYFLIRFLRLQMRCIGASGDNQAWRGKALDRHVNESIISQGYLRSIMEEPN